MTAKNADAEEMKGHLKTACDMIIKHGVESTAHRSFRDSIGHLATEHMTTVSIGLVRAAIGAQKPSQLELAALSLHSSINVVMLSALLALIRDANTQWSDEAIFIDQLRHRVDSMIASANWANIATGDVSE